MGQTLSMLLAICEGRGCCTGSGNVGAKDAEGKD